MNLATSDGLAGDLLFANFNQDFTSLAVGGRYGYRILGLNSVDKLEEVGSIVCYIFIKILAVSQCV